MCKMCEHIQRQRRATTEAYQRQHMTPAIREAMALWGMTEEEYMRRLQAVLFPFPIIVTTNSTGDHCGSVLAN